MKTIIAFFCFFCQEVAAQTKPEIAFIIKERDLIPEGITYDPDGKNFYIGSIHKQKIIKINKEGVISDFVKSGQDGLRQVIGSMKVQNNQLWVCNNSPDYDTLSKVANISVYDLKTAQLVKKYQLTKKQKDFFNDLYLTSSGDAYITDSETGSISYIKKESDKLEEFTKAGLLVFPNGITATPDEKKILVATGNNMGIVSIDIKSREIIPLESFRFLILGIDGLYRFNNNLIGIQNTTFPESIQQFNMSKDFSEIMQVKLLAIDSLAFDLPTTGVIVGNYFYFIANSQLWQTAGNKVKFRQPSELKNIIIMKIKI